MKKARLIKKTELAEQKPPAQPARAAQQALAKLTQKSLTQWVGAYRDSRRQDARVAFAALFTTEA